MTENTVGETPGPIPGDAPPGDTYSREQAARVLSLSPRRITQLAQDGRLEVVQESPLRLSAQSVHEERDRRRSPDRDMRAVVPAPDAATLISTEVAAVREALERAYQRQIEAGEALLSETQAERDRLREEMRTLADKAEAEAERLRAEAAQERERAEAERERAEKERARAEAWARRRWWQRRPTEE